MTIGHLKTLAVNRPELKLVFMSATLDTEVLELLGPLSIVTGIGFTIRC